MNVARLGGSTASQALSFGDDTKPYHFRKALSGTWDSWEEKERGSNYRRSQTKAKDLAGDSEEVTH